MFNSIFINNASTNGMSINAFIYYRIKLKYISLSKRCSFPFANTAIAIIIIIAIAAVKA